MIRMINKLTKTDMWVHEDRVEAYKAAGHKPAATVEEATQEAPAEEQPEEAPEEHPEEVQAQEPEEKPAKKKSKK